MQNQSADSGSVYFDLSARRHYSVWCSEPSWRWRCTASGSDDWHTHLSPCNEFDITPLPHPKQICMETCLYNNTHSEEQICLQSHCRSLKWPKIYRVNQDTKCRNTRVHSYIVKICICIHKTTLWLHKCVHLQQTSRSTEKQTASHRCIAQRKDQNYLCYFYNKMWLNIFKTDVYLMLKKNELKKVLTFKAPRDSLVL